ncbi:hypothetical protein TNCV_73951 [Trichonephila clavipes]|nr:hypothetical protein TNCV_73951 [Trichonephila clavipes]
MPYRHSALLQTASNGRSGHRIIPNRLHMLFYGSSCCCLIHLFHAHNPPVIMGSGATREVRSAPSVRCFLLHPAMTDPHHSCLISSNTLTDFYERYVTIPVGYNSSLVEFRNLIKRGWISSTRHR